MPHKPKTSPQGLQCHVRAFLAELSENDIEVTHVNRHFRKIERAVARGDRVAALSRLRSLVSFEADADDEHSLLDRAARENEAEADE